MSSLLKQAMRRDSSKLLEKWELKPRLRTFRFLQEALKKADWDVGLAVDAIKMAPKLDTVIIISGDGDFVPLVEYLKMNEGCQVEVVSFGKSSSGKLKESVDDFFDLDSNPRKYLLNSGRPPRRSGKITHPQADVENPLIQSSKNKTAP